MRCCVKGYYPNSSAWVACPRENHLASSFDRSKENRRRRGILGDRTNPLSESDQAILAQGARHLRQAAASLPLDGACRSGLTGLAAPSPSRMLFVKSQDRGSEARLPSACDFFKGIYQFLADLKIAVTFCRIISRDSAIAARVTAFGMLKSNGRALSFATRVKVMRTRSDTVRPNSARTPAASFFNFSLSGRGRKLWQPFSSP